MGWGGGASEPRLSPGTMPLLWVMIWSALPPPAHLSDQCGIHESSSFQNELLNSLQCYNDYTSSVRCRWRETLRRNETLQLWFKTYENRPCESYTHAVHGEDRTVQCQYKAKGFGIGTKHAVFFLKNETEKLCASGSHKTLDLSQHLRARPPANLSTHRDGDGGRRLSWSGPYPPSSSLSGNVTYQLSYRTARQDAWTTEYVTETTMNLDKTSLLPGHMYEARVRARTSVGHWSHWSPVVTWRTEDDAGQFPSVHCVLHGEKEVMCSWEVSRELAHFITYQLACRPNRTATSETCCVNPTVTCDPSGTVLKYSCWLSVADPAHLLLELRPSRNAKIFEVHRNIQPSPPQEVRVREKNNEWLVEWSNPSPASKCSLYHQVCYGRVQSQDCSLLNISVGSLSVTVLQSSLVPSQRYQVRVRSLVVPGDDSIYDGIPSEWSDPVEWTSHEAIWSITTLIYIAISALVAAVFITLYCSIPACQRKVVLWVDSVPSPHKSKILSDMKSDIGRSLMQNETTTICKVQHSVSISTCSSVVSLWPTKDGKKGGMEEDESCWRSDNRRSVADEENGSDTSFMSFSGPYIFCQPSEPNTKPEDVTSEETETETETEAPPGDSASPSPVDFALYGKGYVCLPSRGVSMSTQDLVSLSHANTNARGHESGEQDHPDATPSPDETDEVDEPICSVRPPAYTSTDFAAWPQAGSVQASGYCHLPPPAM